MNTQVHFFATSFALLLGFSALSGVAKANCVEEVSDAQVIASRISDEPIAPQEMVDQIEADLAAIRAAYPSVADVEALQWWVPGQLWVYGADEGDKTAEQGVGAAIGLAFTYGLCEFYNSGTWAWFEFIDPFTPRVIGPEFGAIQGIGSWSGYGSTDGSDIQSTEVGRYTFIERWGDCPSGCLEEQYWEFEVNSGVVTLVGSVAATPESTGRLKARHVRQ